jgi:hypothetical protein
MESTTMTTPMTSLDQITADIATTKGDLAKAKEQGDTPMISIWATLLAEQQKERNLLLCAQSKRICMI